MNGIKMSDCKFYVNKDERVIVCVISNTRDMLENFIMEHFKFPDITLGDGLIYWSKFYKQLHMPDSFIGKAVCMPEDEWDEELGKMIAFSKAKDKCYKSFFKRANLFIQTIDRRLGDAINTFNNFGLALEDKREGMKQKINEKLGINE